ncbi:MAG: DUF1003 domain-containing protein [Thiocapsa sp.]|nr:DUF1003 domain-containing protein [Thiocapsa sp.]MCG6897930.1 DUF1003 domain-containing protein [Thiocapsa sp.]
MNMSYHSRANRLFRKEWEKLSDHERDVIQSVLQRIQGPPDANEVFADRRTFGERASDRIAAFGGSWTFIILFFAWLVFWTVLNTDVLGPRHEAFDPYPYVFLNLILSMLAAIQAPIIMMSQNRQAARDRVDAEVDHEVNVRTELGINQLDERLRAIDARLAELALRREPAASGDAAE